MVTTARTRELTRRDSAATSAPRSSLSWATIYWPRSFFGSRARGDAIEDSDWDVPVVVREAADERSAHDRLWRLRGDLIGQIGEAVQFVVLKWSAADHKAALLNVRDDEQRL